MIPPWAVAWLRLTFWAITYLGTVLLSILVALTSPLPSVMRWVILTLLLAGIVADARQKSASSPTR